MRLLRVSLSQKSEPMWKFLPSALTLRVNTSESPCGLPCGFLVWLTWGSAAWHQGGLGTAGQVPAAVWDSSGSCQSTRHTVSPPWDGDQCPWPGGVLVRRGQDTLLLSHHACAACPCPRSPRCVGTHPAGCPGGAQHSTLCQHALQPSGEVFVNVFYESFSWKDKESRETPGTVWPHVGKPVRAGRGAPACTPA